MSLLSSDILHQVFKFFVSDNQIVDGESLRVASLVCKQWRVVADSKTLWSTAIGGNNENTGENNSSTVHRSLQIKERNGDAFDNEIALEASLMGFKKLQCYRGEYPELELYFHVIERATGRKLSLSMSREQSPKHSLLICDIYESHCRSREDFLRESKENSVRLWLPLGISAWQGRVVRWYRYESGTEATGTIDRIKPSLAKESDHQRNVSSLAKLIDFEKIFKGEEKHREVNDWRQQHYANKRQHMVDWVSDGSERNSFTL